MEMRGLCGRCNKRLQPDAVAFICSYECAFCEECSKMLKYSCPNCNGELVRKHKKIVAHPSGAVRLQTKAAHGYFLNFNLFLHQLCDKAVAFCRYVKKINTR